MGWAGYDFARNKYFNPRKKAKQFASGRFTATQTGAAEEARRYAEEQKAISNNKKVANAAQDTQSWEDFISGKGSQ